MKSDKLHKSIQQKFNNCNDATLFVESFDLLGGKGIFYKLNIKKATVRCNETYKIIRKKHWNQQTKNSALELKKQLKITKGGWYFMGILFLVGLFSGVYGMYQGTIQTKVYKENYISKTREEKQLLRANLNKEDLIRTLHKVYKIVKVDKQTLTLLESDITPTSHVNKPIDSTKFNPSAFSNNKEIIVDKILFINYGILTDKLENKNGDNVFQILDRE